VYSRRIFAFSTATVCAAFLAACGGGGSGPTPAPTPTPTNASYRPAAAGDSFAYAGTLTQTFVRPPLTREPIPSPNPTNSQTLSYTIAQTVTVSAGPASGPFAGASFDFKTVETDTLLGGLKTTTTTTDAYDSLVPAGATAQFRTLGSTATTSDGSTFSTTLGPGNGLLDVLPETAGAVVPANNAAAVRTETDASTQTSTRTTNADGTYTETMAFPDGTRAAATANADGSGSYSVPLIIPSNSTFAVGAPQPNPSGTPFIPITITYAAGLFPTPNTTPTPTIVRRRVGVWYPTPLVLAQQSLVNTGRTMLPAGCNVAPGLTRNANQLVETKTTVDPIFGEIAASTATTYTEPGIGVACLQLSDVVTQYYDFSRQTPFLILTQSTPEQITTTTQTLGITQAAVLGLNSVHRNSIGGGSVVAASVARFDAFLARQRAQRRAVAIARAGERGR